MKRSRNMKRPWRSIRNMPTPTAIWARRWSLSASRARRWHIMSWLCNIVRSIWRRSAIWRGCWRPARTILCAMDPGRRIGQERRKTFDRSTTGPSHHTCSRRGRSRPVWRRPGSCAQSRPLGDRAGPVGLDRCITCPNRVVRGTPSDPAIAVVGVVRKLGYINSVCCRSNPGFTLTV